MALPLINVYAYTMGGIGPVETKDLSALSKLAEKNGVPFYAGRFYPKNHDAKWQLFNLGFNSQTAPWMTWEDLGPTQMEILFVFYKQKQIQVLRGELKQQHQKAHLYLLVLSLCKL